MISQGNATIDNENALALSTFNDPQTSLHDESTLTRYQSFVNMLNHPVNYQHIDPGSYAGYHQRQMQFMTLRAERSQQERERNVQRKLGIGTELLTNVDLAAIQGFQREAREAMLDYSRQLDSHAISTPEYFPEVPAGWTGNPKQPDRILVTAECIEKRSDAQSSVVLANTIEARPFQRHDPSYLNNAERKLLAKKQAEHDLSQAEQDVKQTKNKKPPQSAPKDTSKPITLAIEERIVEEPEPLVRDTSDFTPTPQSLIVQRMDNLQRLRNAVNVIVMQNRAQKALRQIQSAYAALLPIYQRRHQQSKAVSVTSPMSQQRILAALILERQCADNATQTYSEILTLVDRHNNQLGNDSGTERPVLTFNTALAFRPPPITIPETSFTTGGDINTDKPNHKTSVVINRSIPELLFYRFDCTRGCNDRLCMDKELVREEQISIFTDLI